MGEKNENKNTKNVYLKILKGRLPDYRFIKPVILKYKS